MPLAGRNCAWTGMITLSAAVSALIVIIPNEGISVSAFRYKLVLEFDQSEDYDPHLIMSKSEFWIEHSDHLQYQDALFKIIVYEESETSNCTNRSIYLPLSIYKTISEGDRFLWAVFDYGDVPQRIPRNSSSLVGLCSVFWRCAAGRVNAEHVEISTKSSNSKGPGSCLPGPILGADRGIRKSEPQ